MTATTLVHQRRRASSLVALVLAFGVGCGGDSTPPDAGAPRDSGLHETDAGADAGFPDAQGVGPDAAIDAGAPSEVEIDLANSFFRRCDQLCQERAASCVEQCFGEASGARATYRSGQGLTTEFSGCADMIAEAKLSGGSQLSLDGLTCCCL